MHKHQWSKKARKLTAAVVVAALAVAVATPVMAWLVDQGGAVNRFSLPTASTTVSETLGGVKQVHIRNNGNIPAYSRVKLVPSWKQSSGSADASQPLALPAVVTNGQMDLGAGLTLVLASQWEKDWFYKEGIFYCKKVLPVGATSAMLLDHVNVNGKNPQTASLTSEEKARLAAFQLQVLAQSVQQDGQDAQGQPPATATWGVKVDADGQLVP